MFYAVITRLMDRFRSILNSTFVTTYKRTIAVLFIFVLTLAVPVTILLVQQQQDIRQEAAGIGTISGTVRDQSNNPVDITGAQVSLVNVSAPGSTPRMGNIKVDGTYSFNIFQESTFRLGIKLPSGYRIISEPSKAIVISATNKNVANQDFKINVPASNNIKGRFNTACLNRFSGWACKLKDPNTTATVVFYKVGADGKETLISGSATQANQPGRTDAKFDDPPVGAEAACDLTDNQNAKVFYYFTPQDGSIKTGEKVVGYIESINGQKLTPKIKLVTSESTTGIKKVVTQKFVTLDNGNKIDVCREGTVPEPQKKFTVSGNVLVKQQDGERAYRGVKGAATITLTGKTQDNKSVKQVTTTVVADNGAKAVGSYSFDNQEQLPPGTYTLTVSLTTTALADYTILAPISKEVKVTNADQKGINFYLQAKTTTSEKGSISGIVYEETTPVNVETSEFTPGKDKALSGIKLRLDTGKIVTTAANGRYTFDGLDLGKTYKVSVVEADVASYRPATATSRQFVLSKNRVDVDFGFLQKTTNNGDTKIAIAVTMPGIGNGQKGDNLNPKRKERQADLIILNAENQKVFDGKATLNYSQEGCSANSSFNFGGPATAGAKIGCYRGTVGIPGIKTGVYAIKIKLDNTLYRFVRKNSNAQDFDNNPLISIVAGDTNQLPRLDLIAGDIDTEQGTGETNIANLFDYDKLTSCIRKESSCTEQDAIKADLNDNGEVDGLTDLNILYRAFGLRNGE